MITEGNLKTADDSHSYLKDMFKDASQEVLETELEVSGDRDAQFEPVAVLKNKRNISSIEERVTSFYARGMSTRYIHDHIQYIYGIELSA